MITASMKTFSLISLTISNISGAYTIRTNTVGRNKLMAQLTFSNTALLGTNKVGDLNVMKWLLRLFSGALGTSKRYGVRPMI